MGERELMIIASGHALCTHLPQEYSSWDDEVLNDFLINNAWEPFEHMSTSGTWDIIEASLDVLTEPDRRPHVMKTSHVLVSLTALRTALDDVAREMDKAHADSAYCQNGELFEPMTDSEFHQYLIEMGVA